MSNTKSEELKNSPSSKYPQYYKDVSHLNEVDVYRICDVFKVGDHSGAIQHSLKKLLLSGSRTGGKSVVKDITEARDTLTRWLNMQEEDNANTEIH